MCSFEKHKSIVLTNGVRRKIRHYCRHGIKEGKYCSYQKTAVFYLKKYNPTLWEYRFYDK